VDVKYKDVRIKHIDKGNDRNKKRRGRNKKVLEVIFTI
jgi:hypothetical protein